MPRTQGVSSNCTVWLIRRKPKPRIVSRCDCLVPIKLLICVTLIVLACVISYPKISSMFLPRLAHRLLHCNRNFFGFTFTHSDATITVTHHSQCRESHDATTFNDLGDTIHRNHFFNHSIIALFLLLHFSLWFSHCSTPIRTASHVRERLLPTL